jgi:sugar lactone lactonase YvrE
MSLDVAIDVQAKLGEGPRWDARTQRLLWVDIEGRALHVWDPARGSDRAIGLDNRPGSAAPMADGRVLVALADRLVALDLEDESLETLCPVPHEADMRLNDGACDPAGRFWVGSMELAEGPDRAALYRFAGGELEVVLDRVSLSNGLAWSSDARLLYYVDSLTYRIDVFDFDLETGTASDRRPFAVIERGAGVPDGLAIDDEGGVWVGLWAGSAVRRYAADGRLDRVIEVPAERVTACAFGGADRRSLFITTAAPDGRVYVTDAEIAGPAANVFHAGPERRTAPSDAEPTSAR